MNGDHEGVGGIAALQDGEYPDETSNGHINISGNGMSDTYISANSERAVLCASGSACKATKGRMLSHAPDHRDIMQDATAAPLDASVLASVIYATDSIGMINKPTINSDNFSIMNFPVHSSIVSDATKIRERLVVLVCMPVAE
jgi:hypothetical protein